MKESSHSLPARAAFQNYPKYRVVSYHKNKHGAVTDLVVQLQSLPLNTKYRYEFQIIEEADQRKLGEHCDRLWQATDVLMLDADDVFHYRGEDIEDLVYLLCIQWPHFDIKAENYIEMLVEGDGYHELANSFLYPKG